MTCNASGRQHIWTSQAPSTISINNYLSRINFILPLLCYSLVLTFYLRHSSAPFLSPLSCLNSSILGLTFLDLLSDDEHSDGNTNRSYLSAAVLKSLSLLLIVRHCVHIVLSLCLLISLDWTLSLFHQLSFSDSIQELPTQEAVTAAGECQHSLASQFPDTVIPCGAAQATSPFLELPATGGLKRYPDSAESKICLCGTGKGTKGNHNVCLWQKWLQQWQEGDRLN